MKFNIVNVMGSSGAAGLDLVTDMETGSSHLKFSVVVDCVLPTSEHEWIRDNFETLSDHLRNEFNEELKKALNRRANGE